MLSGLGDPLVFENNSQGELAASSTGTALSSTQRKELLVYDINLSPHQHHPVPLHFASLKSNPQQVAFPSLLVFSLYF